MAKTLTIMLTSGAAENEDALTAVKLAKAVLAKGHKVNIYLFGNAVNLSKTETPITGDLHINQTLIDHIEKNKVIKKLIELGELGANISTCHTNEHARGIEAYPYAGNIQWGDIGGTFTKFLMTSDVFLTIGH
ncbi:DsrE family protein [Taurinivorans muris]|uniref:DsrE family protein n=1 Tax=Taurinivorans muris TaxID=2787751 RepID=A0ABY5XZU3_9BACT|nr:DsrE family protein [Desulfovibrionaceae bacterium LT0009]